MQYIYIYAIYTCNQKPLFQYEYHIYIREFRYTSIINLEK